MEQTIRQTPIKRQLSADNLDVGSKPKSLRRQEVEFSAATSMAPPQPRTLGPKESLLLELPPEITQNHIHSRLSLEAHGRLIQSAKTVQYTLGDLPQKIKDAKSAADQIAADLGYPNTSPISLIDDPALTRMSADEITEALTTLMLREHQRNEILQRRLHPALQHWANDLIASSATGRQVPIGGRTPLRQIETALEQVSQWPVEIQQMAAFHLAESVASRMGACSISLARVVDKLLTLDSSSHGATNQPMSASDLYLLTWHLAAADEQNQALIQRYFDECKNRPPMFEAIALLGLSAFIGWVGAPEGVNAQTGSHRRTELFNRLVTRNNELPPEVRSVLRIRLQAAQHLLPSGAITIPNAM